MGQKFVIQPDHIPVNNYRFTVPGLPPITAVSIGSLEKEIDCVDLPDRTQASTGRSKPGETEIAVPSHHLTEIAAMEVWVQEALDPISPTYKKTAILTQISGSRLITVPITMDGVFAYKKATPDQEMDNDGEQSNVTYTLKWDDWN
jgi:hypothetical protein